MGLFFGLVLIELTVSGFTQGSIMSWFTHSPSIRQFPGSRPKSIQIYKINCAALSAVLTPCKVAAERSIRYSKSIGQTTISLNERIASYSWKKSFALNDCLKYRTHGCGHEAVSPLRSSAKPSLQPLLAASYLWVPLKFVSSNWKASTDQLSLFDEILATLIHKRLIIIIWVYILC